MLIDVTSNDAGLYICSILKNSSDTSEAYHLKWIPEVHAHVKVKTRPGVLNDDNKRNQFTISQVFIKKKEMK